MSSRVGRLPIDVPKGVDVQVADNVAVVKGPKGELKQPFPNVVIVKVEEQQIKVTGVDGATNAEAIAGTIRAILQNHVKGVSEGFIKKLTLVGVGYRSQLAKSKDGRPMLNLTLGLSHPVTYVAPHGINLASATFTEIEVTGIDRQLVGQVAADIRGICGGLRKPEPYKGKGIRYADEKIILKETKKK